MRRFVLLICLVLLLPLVPGWAAAAGTSAPTLTSITPSSGETNTTVSIASLNGTDFARNAGIRLRGSSSRDIIGSVTSLSSTRIVGTFNLNKQVPGTYEVCVYNDASTYTCGLTFTITSQGETATNGSVYFETNPTGATVLLNGMNAGTSAFTYHDAKPGTYKVLIKKSGYADYTGSVTIKEGTHQRYYAQLTPLGAGTAEATATPAPTATTVRKSTMKVPTTWPSTIPATTASPVDPALVIGAAGTGIGLLVIRRR
ncbi:MAG: PEGA domain-containing protein [Methanoregula sp.]